MKTQLQEQQRKMEDLRRRAIPWSMSEVKTFLCVVAEDRVQRELDGATRNERVFQDVAQQMASHGYHRTSQQCRDKLKKLKSDYRQVKDHNNRSGSNRKTWKWFDQMDAIYGHRPANQGKENGVDTATSLLEAIENGSVSAIDEGDDGEDPASSPDSESAVVSAAEAAPTASTSVIEGSPAATSTPRSAKRKRRCTQENGDFLREMLATDERYMAQRDRHFQMLQEESRRRDERADAAEAAEAAATAAFNQGMLGVLGQIAQAIAGRNAAQPPK